jgi:hypothetical protein
LPREKFAKVEQPMNRTALFLFTLHVFTRLVFALALGLSNNYALQTDSYEVVRFGLQAAQGDFNFELERFIVSPLFSIVVASFNLLFGEQWSVMLLIFQLLISAMSGIYIYKIAVLLFKSRKVSLLASLLFAAFPLTLWFTHTFSQECLFQALFIFSFYHLIAALEQRQIKHVAYSAVFFGLAYLTKSHILIFSLFIPVLFWHAFKGSKTTIVYSMLYASIALAFSLPFGLYTLNKHGSYVLSSNGAGYQFYLGNTEAGYKTIVDVPAKGTADYLKMNDITVHAGYFNGSDSSYNATLQLPQREKQTQFFNEARTWITNNPNKFIELKAYNLGLFFLPGISWRHYSLATWLTALLLSLPIYLGAYTTLIRLIKQRDQRVAPLAYLMASMLIFSIVWYVQNRFRSITIEPIYIVYASAPLWVMIQRVKWCRFALERLEQRLTA